jgi:Tol biopolymer transport system component
VTDVDAERGELAHVRPDLLPDGRRFLYLIRGDRPEHTGIYAGSLGGDLKRKVLALQVPVRYAEPGYLLSVEGTTLVARRFDPDALEVTGEPRVVAEDVEYQARWDWPAFRVSASGLLAYNPLVASPEREILRVDRGGKRLASISAAGDSNLDLAPDGSRLAVIRPDAERRRPYLWIHDLVRGVSSPFAPENAGNGPVWSPDGRQLAYVSFRSPAQTICVRPAAGGVERTLWSDSSIVEPVDWSPDGRWLLVETGKPGEGGNLMLVPVEGGGEPQPFLATSAGEHSGRFSPDGSLVAYTSDASGRDEVYLEPLARTGERWQVSSDGGAAPRWSADGAELFYVRPGTRELDSTLVAVTVERTADEPRLGVSRPLGPIGSQDYEPVAGGGEFIVAVAVGQREAAPPVLITNWPALLDERRPGP